MYHLAIDLGAGSGRGIVYRLKGDQLQAKEVHRFGGYDLRDGVMQWDINAIYNNIIQAITNCGTEGLPIVSIGIDTWGVDYTVINKDGSIPNPYHYRDQRTVGIIEDFDINVLPTSTLYEKCGIAPTEFNTIYQCHVGAKDGQFDSAQKFGFISSILGYMLTGNLATEPTIASTSGFYNRASGFDGDLLTAIGVDKSIMPDVLPTDSILGYLKPELMAQFGQNAPIAFVMTPAHDTAAAISAIPHLDGNKLFLSAGTWSLFGTLNDDVINTPVALSNGYSNELGIGNVRFLRNITGFWILQECMKDWKKDIPSLNYGDVNCSIDRFRPSTTFINIADKRFTAPRNMIEEIKAYVQETGQKQLDNSSEIANCIYTSLALEYRHALNGLMAITGKTYNSLNIFGGGCQNNVLCSYIAASLDLPVHAGIVEASSLGNAISQMIALKVLPDRHVAHQIIEKSYPIYHFAPYMTAEFDSLYHRYLKLK